MDVNIDASSSSKVVLTLTLPDAPAVGFTVAGSGSRPTRGSGSLSTTSLTELSRSNVTPIASRFSARKSRKSVSAPSRPLTALATSLGVFVNSVVTLARF